MSDACRTHCHGGHGAAVPRPMSAGLDMLAAILSSLCLVHCIAIPVAVALLPALALVVPDLPWLHAGLLVLAIPASGLAMWRGWRVHRNRTPAIMGVIGLLVMTSALFAPSGTVVEIALNVVGGLIVAAAHLRNLRAGTRHRR